MSYASGAIVGKTGVDTHAGIPNLALVFADTIECMDHLATLAKLALRVAQGQPEDSALTEAAALVQRRTGAVTVALVYAEGDGFGSSAVGQDIDLAPEALMYLQQRLVQLRVPLAFNLVQDKVEFITRASNKQRRDYVAFLIPSPETWTEMLVLRGTWAGSAAAPLIDFIDSAMPALAMILDGHVGSSRKDRVDDQLKVIAASVQTLREMSEVVGSVAAVVPGRGGLPADQSELLRTLASRAETVLHQVESQRDLAESHLRLQQYTLDYTMQLERSIEAERRNATTDALTGLVNHRGALQLLQAACQSSTTDGRPLSLIMADVDGFKLFNDTYGHITGDAILKAVADVLRRATGDRGTACRYGGDEFLLILPCPKRAAGAVAKTIIELVARAEFRTEDGSAIPISVSIGLTSFPEDTRTPADLVSHADAAMYAAKKQTRPSGSNVISITDHTTFGVLDSLVQAIDAKDRYTRAHCDIVAEYAVKLAKRMGLHGDSQRALHVAGLLHDVGKLVVPDEILKKPGPLTPEEYAILKRHVKVGEVLIREVPQLTEVTQAVACHHERFDGTGYPRGMRGEAIPLIGRVIAVADAYSAMRLDRAYRKGMGQDRVLSELVAGAGTQFDPDIAKIFAELLLEEDVLGHRQVA